MNVHMRSRVTLLALGFVCSVGCATSTTDLGPGDGDGGSGGAGGSGGGIGGSKGGTGGSSAGGGTSGFGGSGGSSASGGAGGFGGVGGVGGVTSGVAAADGGQRHAQALGAAHDVTRFDGVIQAPEAGEGVETETNLQRLAALSGDLLRRDAVPEAAGTAAVRRIGARVERGAPAAADSADDSDAGDGEAGDSADG